MFKSKVNEYSRNKILLNFLYLNIVDETHPAFTFSKLIVETLEQGVKYFQSQQ